MPKIELLTASNLGNIGDIVDKPQDWINHYARKIGVEFDLVQSEKKAQGIEVAGAEDSKERAFMNLSEGDRDSVRKGFKELVLRKAGWILRECGNKALQEIHISAIDRTEQIKTAKDSAVKRASEKMQRLVAYRSALIALVSGDQFELTFDEDSDKDEILKEISLLTFKD